MKSTNVFIDISFGVHLWSKWNYVINIWRQPINSSILKNLCQAKHEKHLNKKIMDIPWFNTCGLLIIKKRIDQVLLLSNGHLWNQLDHMKKIIIDDLIQQTRGRVSRMSLWKIWSDVWDMMIRSWKMVNKDLIMMNHASEKSKWKS
jgi:hypothetical protein